MKKYLVLFGVSFLLVSCSTTEVYNKDGTSLMRINRLACLTPDIKIKTDQSGILEVSMGEKAWQTGGNVAGEVIDVAQALGAQALMMYGQQQTLSHLQPITIPSSMPTK